MTVLDYPFDDELLESVTATQRPHTRLYTVDQTIVVLGRGSKVELELNADTCVADAVPIYRRRGGGCSVVIDVGNIIVSYATPMTGIGDNSRYLQVLSDWMITGLAQIGFSNVHRDGICDLVYNDKKISGACLYRTRDLLYYSATLLITPDLPKLSRYLRHPPREPSYRNGRNHDSFVGALGLGQYTDITSILRALQQTLLACEL